MRPATRTRAAPGSFFRWLGLGLGRARGGLVDLDERLLRDIGLSPADAEFLSRRRR